MLWVWSSLEEDLEWGMAGCKWSEAGSGVPQIQLGHVPKTQLSGELLLITD